MLSIGALVDLRDACPPSTTPREALEDSRARCPSEAKVITDAQRNEFYERGFVRIPGAFPAAAAEAMQDRIWAALESRLGVSPTDRNTWTLPAGLGLRALKAHKVFEPIGSAVTLGCLDQLLGKGRWKKPAEWGQFLVSVPTEPVPAGGPRYPWHTDWPYAGPSEGPFGALLFSYLSEVPPGGGGTLAIEGSPSLIRNFVQERPSVQREKMKVTRLALMHSDPWLRSLNAHPHGTEAGETLAGSEARVDGVRLKIAELCGEPGEVILAHPWLLHAGAPNHGDRPRFMRVQRIRSA